jgi:hypothetical protein
MLFVAHNTVNACVWYLPMKFSRVLYRVGVVSPCVLHVLPLSSRITFRKLHVPRRRVQFPSFPRQFVKSKLKWSNLQNVSTGVRSAISPVQLRAERRQTLDSPAWPGLFKNLPIALITLLTQREPSSWTPREAVVTRWGPVGEGGGARHGKFNKLMLFLSGMELSITHWISPHSRKSACGTIMV